MKLNLLSFLFLQFAFKLLSHDFFEEYTSLLLGSHQVSVALATLYLSRDAEANIKHNNEAEEEAHGVAVLELACQVFVPISEDSNMQEDEEQAGFVNSLQVEAALAFVGLNALVPGLVH